MVMKGMGPVLVDALLSIPPVCDDERLGPVLVGCFALDTASEVEIDDGTLGPVLTDALLPIPPVIISLSECY